MVNINPRVNDIEQKLANTIEKWYEFYYNLILLVESRIRRQ